jgi:hypothetical protein
MTASRFRYVSPPTATVVNKTKAAIAIVMRVESFIAAPASGRCEYVPVGTNTYRPPSYRIMRRL